MNIFNILSGYCVVKDILYRSLVFHDYFKSLLFMEVLFNHTLLGFRGQDKLIFCANVPSTPEVDVKMALVCHIGPWIQFCFYDRFFPENSIKNVSIHYHHIIYMPVR